MEQYPTYLIHYGIQGQKWGVRRFQNEDGTWTSEGLERRKQYYTEDGELNSKGVKLYNKAIGKMQKSKEGENYKKVQSDYYKLANKATDKANREAYKSVGKEKEYMDSNIHKSLIGKTKDIFGDQDERLWQWRESNPEKDKDVRDRYNEVYNSLRKEYLDKKYNEVIEAEKQYLDVGQKYLDEIAGIGIMNLKRLRRT